MPRISKEIAANDNYATTLEAWEAYKRGDWADQRCPLDQPHHEMEGRVCPPGECACTRAGLRTAYR